MHFERQMPSKMHKLVVFFFKMIIMIIIIIIKFVCLPNLKFSDPLPEIHFFLFGPLNRSVCGDIYHICIGI